ncbi:tRNA pseudouridine(38-40) synthase TruA [Fulvivirga sedimenti]|uniref:tRNA pseudouridine synthase A n=1 Tax=Fulvivirga sedimenti TaxID=2879465 RepID=A0A9X1HY50_9BACT|nr:tRNA pseudouridine(38-40) synthase TruA [Fulvivirga sedimenti]MCA6078652.1 tRNA pseudouridine(38-40) synthase TruA [Fulvivirga sedimenti]
MDQAESVRYFFEIAYRGTKYHGWQRQKNAHTVQEEVENALVKLWPEAGAVVGSGRTDTGVHCEQQYFHLDLPGIKNLQKAAYRLNRILPNDIAIREIRSVREDAHARFSAVSRSYLYRISRNKNVFADGLTYRYERPLDLEIMNKGAEILKTFEDFQAFSKVNTDVNHFLCNILGASWEETGEEYHFRITANRFLRGMVRAIVGTLLLLGEGKINMSEFTEIIESRDRKQAGAAAPPEGLYLVAVEYPEEIYLN